MDIMSTVESVFVRGLDQGNRPLTLQFAGKAAALFDGVVVPQRLEISEGVCESTVACITCLSTSHALPLDEFKGLPIEIGMVTDVGDLRRINVIVLEVRQGQSDGALTVLQLKAGDIFSLMDGRRSNRVFLNKSAPDIARIVLDGWRSRYPALAEAFDYLLLDIDEAQYPPRALTFQAHQSDSEFLRMLFKRNGISWFFRPGQDALTQELVLFDNARQLPANSAGTINYHRRDGTEPFDTISLLAPTHTLVGGQVTRSSWDHETSEVDTATETIMVDQGERGNGVASALVDARIELPHAGDTSGDHQRLTLVDMQRQEGRAKCLHGVGGVRAQAVGEWNQIDGNAMLDALSPEDREYITVQLSTWCENNFPKELQERTQNLLATSESGVRGWIARSGDLDASSPDTSQRHVNRFVAVRRDVPILPAWDPQLDLPRMGVMTATVVGAANTAVWCDELGRVKVRIHGLDPADHAHAGGAGANGDDGDSAWVRVNFLWCGDGFGMIFPLRPGMEVILGFEHGDPSRPMIVGTRYNATQLPPRFDHLGSLPKNVALSGVVTRELNGARQQQLRFDDSPGSISVQLGTDHAATQLNIGALSTPMEEGRNTPRGEGYELRTAAHGVLRAGAGMLVTTEGRDAGERVTDMAETTARLANAQAQHQNLADAAQQAQAQLSGDQDDVAKALKIQVQDIRGSGAPSAKNPSPEFQQPHLALASPAGLETSTQGSTHVASVEHNALTSGGHTSVSAGKSFLVSVKEAVRLFAYNAGMKLVAASADIEISALKNSVNILAKLDITQTATRITIAAKEEVLINGGGSFSRWNGSGIEHGTNGACRQQAASHTYAGPANAPPPQLKPVDVSLKETPPEEQVAFSMQHVPGVSPMLFAGQAYTLLKDGAEVKKGLFDAYGRMTVDKADKGAQYQVKLFNGTVHDVPVAADRMASDPADPQYNEQHLSNDGYRADGRGGDDRLAQRDRGTVADSSTTDA